MFLLDSLMISGIQWALKTVVAAAEAEMNDDAALRDRLMEAEMQREAGEITDEDFAQIETDLLRAIREIKERREGGAGAFAFSTGQPVEAGEGARFSIEADVTGDFHEQPAEADLPPQNSAANQPPVVHAELARRPRQPRTARSARKSRRK